MWNNLIVHEHRLACHTHVSVCRVVALGKFRLNKTLLCILLWCCKQHTLWLMLSCGTHSLELALKTARDFIGLFMNRYYLLASILSLVAFARLARARAARHQQTIFQFRRTKISLFPLCGINHRRMVCSACAVHAHQNKSTARQCTNKIRRYSAALQCSLEWPFGLSFFALENKLMAFSCFISSLVPCHFSYCAQLKYQIISF